MLTCSTDVWVRRGAVTLSVFAVAACGESPTGPDGDRPQFSQSQTGNGAPSGWHFNLNIIGVEKGHENDISPNAQGHVIFVPLTGPCDIKLTMGDYQVTDWSCLDGDRDAGFQLPDPDPGDNGGLLAYSVWVRARGKPTGSATMTTCFFEFSSATTWCNAGELVVRINRIDAGKFVDVSKELLQVCADVDPTASEDLELVPLFSPLGTDYFWHYENTGLRLAQLRLYPIATTAIGGDCTRTTHPSH